jgi:hypothetical protein
VTASDAAAALAGIAREQGVAMLADPRLLESRLRTEARADAAATDAMLAALDAGVPQFLLAGTMTPEALTERLTKDRLLAPATAASAVAAWSAAIAAMPATAPKRAATPTGDEGPPRPRRRIWRPILLVPAFLAGLALVAVIRTPEPRADPVVPTGGLPAGGTTTGTGTASGSTSSGGTGTGTAGGTGTGGGSGTAGGGGTAGGTTDDGSGGSGSGTTDGGDQPPGDPEAELRAMFPQIDCPRKTDGAYGVVHLECPGIWLIRFATPDEAVQFFTATVRQWQASPFPWQDGRGAGGFAATAFRVIPGGSPTGNPMIIWGYTSPERARTVIGEAVGAPQTNLLAWWVAVRSPAGEP